MDPLPRKAISSVPELAGDIGIAEATVKVHRSRLMRKMKAHSLPELGRMADKLKLVPEKPQYS